ncbi:MAG: type I 3-dehydroquinate dehydratase [Candidatus Thorarchaeota archaeon]|jgi:3-dehydroquinate dehydratase type I
MKKVLCVSLTKRTAKECLEFIPSCEADMIEHRLDFMERIELLKDIYRTTQKPIIATCRSEKNGGRFTGNEDQRIRHLLTAISSGASFVDVEIETAPVNLALVRGEASKAGCRLIISKHYHDSTPTESELAAMLRRLSSVGAEIMKIVTTPKSSDDCMKILQLYFIEKKRDTSLIAFAMGSLGRFTRVFALFLGAPFMYTSIDHGEVAAPGQISFSDMKLILEVLQ